MFFQIIVGIILVFICQPAFSQSITQVGNGDVFNNANPQTIRVTKATCPNLAEAKIYLTSSVNLGIFVGNQSTGTIYRIHGGPSNSCPTSIPLQNCQPLVQDFSLKLEGSTLGTFSISTPPGEVDVTPHVEGAHVITSGLTVLTYPGLGLPDLGISIPANLVPLFQNTDGSRTINLTLSRSGGNPVLTSNGNMHGFTPYNWGTSIMVIYQCYDT